MKSLIKVLAMGLMGAAVICLTAATGQAAPAGAGQGNFFVAADKDGDGFLSKAEFLAVVPQAGEEGFRITDRDRDGRISHQEFAQMPGGRSQGMNPRGAFGGRGGETRFRAMDSNRDGELSFGEINTALPRVSQEAFKAADLDGNGRLSHAEWSALKTKLGLGLRRRTRTR